MASNYFTDKKDSLAVQESLTTLGFTTRKLIYQICPKARRKLQQLKKLHHQEKKETFPGALGLKGTNANIYRQCLALRALS